MEVEREKGAVRWEGILRRASVRVLLAEADDSTREIVGALLRKCGYTVVSVSDGLKAWQTLIEIRQEVDLVLMEVELPLVSGFELLTMIMEDETFKHIPVIMMSSHDYISMVFKFMLKGAADFLVKPLRKNELRNLWQHVWRRHSLSGDSGEPNARKEYISACIKSGADSENDAASNYCGDYLACAERNRECSEKGSDTQSSCTLSAMDGEGAHEQNKNHLNEVQLKGIFRHTEDDFEREKGSGQKEFFTTAGPNAFGNGAIETKVEIHRIKPCIVTPDLLGAVDMPIVWHDIETRSTAAVKSSDDSGMFIRISDSMSKHCSMPELKLSLKIHESSNYTSLANGRLSILNHSNLSAFSRYNSKSMLPSPPASIDLPEEKKGSFCKIQQPKEPNSHDDECSYAGNSAVQFKDKAFNFNAEDTCSTLTTTSNQEEKAVQHHNPHIAPYIISTNPSTFSSSLESTASPQLGAPPWIFDTTFVKVVPYLFSQQSAVEVDNSEQSRRFHDQSVRKEKHGVQKPTRTAEAVNGSSCLDQSDSGIMHGDHTKCIDDDMLGSNCNRINDSLGEDVANSTKESLSLGGFPPVSGMDAQYQRAIHREMALNKFRLKRKERCFEKKVRYQSRKKLAEQRPRVKGQFVRQVQPNPVSMQVNNHVDDL